MRQLPKRSIILLAFTAAASVACSGSDGEAIDAPDTDGTDGSPAATRPSGEPQPITVEGRISDGVECPVLTTPDGDVWSLSLGEADFGPGDYVRFTGERMDASICMQGKGTLVPERIEEIDPPARDRDPARAGGVKLTVEYVTGSWVAKGPDADCDRPDFRIVTSPAATVLQGDISRHDDSALVVLDQYPRIDLDEPMDDLPIESRGPDGLAILRPATDAEYDPIRIGSATIKGDGVVFVKCG